MRGRKAVELRAIEGGLSKAPRAPVWLPPEAKEEWRRVLPDLIKRGVLTKVDLSAVENYCFAIGQIRECQKTIAMEGAVIETKHGSKRHPLFQTLQQMLTESRRLASELGLMPASRNKAERAPASESIGDQQDLFADLGI